ncbi:MAG: alkaline phosphatase family protein [Planctomycetes bacterium]|nr:alkaline phosphatase family protein [Planctomycetota bacterium]
MTDANSMDSSSSAFAPSRSVGKFAAGSAAAFAATLAVSISAPSLMRPLLPSAAFIVLLPFLLGAVFCGLFGRLRGLISTSDENPIVPAVLGSLLGALPWLLVAGAPIAKVGWIAWLAGVLAVALACLFRRQGHAVAMLGILAAGGILMFEPDRSINQESVNGMKPLVVLGLDSATWDQIDPMIEAGELPNMKRLLEIGARGQLDSEKPTLSARIWTIIATGRTAKDNGILDFERDRRNLKVGRVWDVVHEKEGKIGLTGWLMTWPPDPFPGFCMPGWESPGEHTFPMELAFLAPLIQVGRQDLSIFSLTAMKAAFSGLAISTADHVWENMGHFWHVITASGNQKEKREQTFWRMQLVFANLSSDAWFDQMALHRPTFGGLLITPVDTLGHHYWAYHEPAGFPDLEADAKEEFRDVLRDGYRKSDEVLGRLLERIDFETTTLMIFSDHGMQALQNGGRRTVRPKPGNFIQFVGLDPVLLRVRAAVAGNQLIMTCDNPDPGDSWEVLEEVRTRMLAIRVEENPDGRPFKFEDFPEGNDTLVMDFLPRELGSEENHLVFEGERTALANMFYQESRTGVHHERGIMVVAGPGVKKGGTFDGASIYDCAPNMLYGMGLAVPEGLPGKVSIGAWEETHLGSHPVQTVAGYLPAPPPAQELKADPNMQMNALAQIGYVDGTDGKKKKKKDE